MFYVRTISALVLIATALTGCGRQSSKDRPGPNFNAQSCQSTTRNDLATLFDYSNSQAGRLAHASQEQILHIHATCTRFHHSWSDPVCRTTHPLSSGSFDSDYQKVIRYCKEVDKYVQSMNKPQPLPSAPIAHADNPKVEDLNRYNRVKLTFNRNTRNTDPEFGNKLAQCYVDFDSYDLPEIPQGERATVINVDVKRMQFEFMYDITAYLEGRTKLISVFCTSSTRNLRLREIKEALAPVIDVRIQ